MKRSWPLRLLFLSCIVAGIGGCGGNENHNNTAAAPLPGSGSGGAGGGSSAGGGSGGSGSTSFTVVATDPPAGAVGVQLNDPIIVTFNNPVDPATINAGSFLVTDAVSNPVNGVVSTSGRTARFTPAARALAKSTLYTVTLTTGAKDSSGNALAADFAWKFTTTTDAWTSTAVTTSAASARIDHTAVWTGTEMIVWGGIDSLGPAITGARYDPISSNVDPWERTATTAVPLGRTDHTAVWTGTEMIVWGGNLGGGLLTNTGGRYTPATAAGSWKAMSNASGLLPRRWHTAVWSGTDMIVWGGLTTLGAIGNGAKYHPATDSWTGISLSGAPLPRFGHTAVWSGSEMIIWGGDPGGGFGFTNSGGRFRVATGDWRPVSTIGAPSARIGHTAVWTGKEMIVWGGTADGVTALNDGARYDPATDTWRPMQDAPIARSGHDAIWTGTEMIVWGGDNADISGAAYNPAHDTWRTIANIGAPTARVGQTAIWTGNEMIVWGGNDGTLTNTGGRYTP